MLALTSGFGGERDLDVLGRRLNRLCERFKRQLRCLVAGRLLVVLLQVLPHLREVLECVFRFHIKVGNYVDV